MRRVRARVRRRRRGRLVADGPARRVSRRRLARDEARLCDSMGRRFGRVGRRFGRVGAARKGARRRGRRPSSSSPGGARIANSSRSRVCDLEVVRCRSDVKKAPTDGERNTRTTLLTMQRQQVRSGPDTHLRRKRHHRLKSSFAYRRN